MNSRINTPESNRNNYTRIPTQVTMGDRRENINSNTVQRLNPVKMVNIKLLFMQ